MKRTLLFIACVWCQKFLLPMDKTLSDTIQKGLILKIKLLSSLENKLSSFENILSGFENKLSSLENNFLSGNRMFFSSYPNVSSRCLIDFNKKLGLFGRGFIWR